MLLETHDMLSGKCGMSLGKNMVFHQENMACTSKKMVCHLKKMWCVITVFLCICCIFAHLLTNVMCISRTYLDI